jgi:hypothetical protein
VRRLACSAVFALLGCADAAPGVVELEEICGAAAPVRLLALDEAAMATPDDRAVVRHGSRWLIGSRTRTGVPTHDLVGADEAAQRIVSVDECGADTIEIAAGVDTIFLAPRPTAPSFACDGGVERMTWIDPDGARPSVEVGAVGCSFIWIDDDVVFAMAAAEDEEHLVRATFDGSGRIAATEILVEGLRRWAPKSGFVESRPVLDDLEGRVIALGDDEVLVEIDVRTLDSQALRSSVEGFGIWNGIVVYGTRSTRFVWDLATDVETEIDAGSFGYSPFATFGGDVAALQNNEAWGRTLLITLDGHERTTISGTWRPIAAMDDGARIVEARSSQDKLGLYRWMPDDDVEQFSGPVVETWTEGELWTVAYSYAAHERAQKVVTYDVGSMQEHVVVEDVYRPWPWTDETWLTVRPELGEVSGPLVLVDPADGSARVVDEDVHLELAGFRGGSNPASGREHDGTILYVVEHGARRGLWRARLSD